MFRYSFTRASTAMHPLLSQKHLRIFMSMLLSFICPGTLSGSRLICFSSVSSSTIQPRNYFCLDCMSNMWKGVGSFLLNCLAFESPIAVVQAPLGDIQAGSIEKYFFTGDIQAGLISNLAGISLLAISRQCSSAGISLLETSRQGSSVGI